MTFSKVQDLRYGENPHQAAAFYRDRLSHGLSLAQAQQLQGRALSYTNLLDINAALGLVLEFPEGPACCIVKHTNPCGVGLADTLVEAFERRYEAISRKLKTIPSPWFVDFDFQPAGIRTESGQFPIVRMEWAEGCSLAQFISEHRDEPQTLLQLRDTLRDLARHLQAHDIAHGDIQPGNIIVRSASDLKLVDYDGMCVPALTMLKSAELGHPNFQHPQRAKEGIYSLEVDRFSHLVIYTALRALMAGGPALWEKYDNGDNLLFNPADFAAPAKSAVFQELSEARDPVVKKLVGTLATAAAKRLEESPLLSEVAVKPPAAKARAAKA